MLSHSLITGVTQNNRIPGEQAAMNFTFSEKGTGRPGEAGVLITGAGFTDYFGIDLLAGRLPEKYQGPVGSLRYE